MTTPHEQGPTRSPVTLASDAEARGDGSSWLEALRFAMMVLILDGIVRALEGKQAQLKTDLARMAAPPDDPSAISFGKRVGEGTSMAVNRLVQVSVHEQMQALLRDVRRALAKVAEDTYGTCDRCGVTIPPERLEVLPWATLCVRCAGQR